METTMTLVYDGQKELMKAKGFKTVEELKVWQKETFENDPSTIKCRNADVVIVDVYIKSARKMPPFRVAI